MEAWAEAETTLYGAAVAYYAVFSLAPLLLVTLTLVGFFFDYGTASDAVLVRIGNGFGESTAAFVESQLALARPEAGDIAVAGFGILATLLGATAIFTTIESGLDRIFARRPAKDAPSGLRAAIMRRAAAFGLVLGMSLLILASLIANVVIDSAAMSLQAVTSAAVVLPYLAEFAISFLAIGFFIALMIKFLPTRHLPWLPALLGGLVGSALFSLGKYAAGAYLAIEGGSSAYGAAASVIVLILWAFYLAQVFFVSAVVTRLYFLKD